MRWYFPLALCLLLFSCVKNRIYEDFINLDGSWHQDSVLTFPFEIQDISRSYNIRVTLTNRHTFPYHNFYFNHVLITATDSVLSESLNEMILFDPKTGAPRGAGSGRLFDHEYYVEEGIQFPASGTYRVDLTQFMRQETMQDIERVGVRVEFRTE